jgi:hypothetical protein
MEEDVFALFSRKRSESISPKPPRLKDSPLAAPLFQTPAEPEDQVALVYQTMQKLNEVRQLVDSLPEIPLGDRDTLLAQLSSTSDSLRSLCFLDAIY